MRKIISFKKELDFKTKVCEITSISLEHVVTKKEDDLISGNFLINGEYKMTEASINREKYEFEIPFDIALNSNYDIDTVNLDIDNFYYEILNNDILKVNIDMLIVAEEKEYIPEVLKPLPREEINSFVEDRNIVLENEVEDISINDSVINISNNYDIVDNHVDKLNDDIVNKVNIFDNFNDNETYSTYYVYIVKDGDTIDKVLDKYSITKEELENYNNLESFKPYDKIIIPTNGK